MLIFIEVKLIFDKVKQCLYNISPSKLPVVQLTQLNIHYKFTPLQTHPIRFQQLPRRIHTVHPVQILNRCKLLFPSNLISQVIVHHVNHVQNKQFELVAIWLSWIYQVAVFINIWNLLFYNMNSQLVVYNFFELIEGKKIVEDYAVFIFQAAVGSSGFGHCF